MLLNAVIVMIVIIVGLAISLRTLISLLAPPPPIFILLSIQSALLYHANCPSIPPSRFILPGPCFSYLSTTHWRVDNSDTMPVISWKWDPFLPGFKNCAICKIDQPKALKLPNSSSVLIAGDRHAGLFTISLCLLLEPSAFPAVKNELYGWRSDYHAKVLDEGINVDFIWAPFETNLTPLLKMSNAGTRKMPNVVVLGYGLLHMLHVNDSTNFGVGLDNIWVVSQ